MDITLSPGTHLQWRCPWAIELQVRAGRLWLTRAGQPQDHFLEAGHRLRLPARQAVTLSAEGGLPLRLHWHLTEPAAIDFDYHRRRALHQRDVARRWYWRRVVRCIKGARA
jgi:hypothetical protein